jgi:ABC-2 type transport system permease protein
MSAASTPTSTGVDVGTRPGGAATSAGGPGFGATVASEWLKVRTARAPRRNVLLGIGLGIALSWLLAFVVGATFDEWTAADQATFDPVLYPMSGSILMAIFFVTASVGTVAPEYGSGMIRLTLTATPRRRRVLAAKALVVTAVIVAASLVSVLGMFLGSQVIFAASDLPTVGLGDSDFVRMIVLLVVTGPVFPILSVAIAFLLRSAAAAITTVLALIFLPSIVGSLLPDWWQRNVVSLLPGPASDSLAIGHVEDSAMYLQPVAAALVVLAWTVGSLLVAGVVLDRRDP